MKKYLLLILFLCGACSFYSPGPDKQFSGMMSGALTGAGTGAVTGFHVASASGPGAAVGAGFGALAGAVHGVIKDQNEENNLRLRQEIEEEQRVSFAQGVLARFIEKRALKHPNREIYPADIFFYGDESQLRSEGKAIISEIAKLNKERFPWSRIVVASYVKSIDEKSNFAQNLAKERAREISEVLAISGINPRRIEPRAIVVPDYIFVDADEKEDRYAQAIEIIMSDAHEAS